MAENNEFEFADERDTELPRDETQSFSDAVLHSADWTVETIVSQLTRGNIDMNPRFQRRDAWSIRRKSAFIESLLLGLPVPQIVLAEKKGQRGKYIVLDGKQRLLSLMQFTGNAEAAPGNNAFRLSGLDARIDLNRINYEALESPAYESDLNAFLNYTIRTVVIRNWPNYDFLHLVFLRLNTGSVRLSPQELRQAMFPGPFSDFVDDAAASSEPLQNLLSRDTPDPRMRDVELLVRFLGFHFFVQDYPGRMKEFLDYTCCSLNQDWNIRHAQIRAAVDRFNQGTSLLINILGADRIARKANSKSFNRAIFDALIFYASDDAIALAISNREDAARGAILRLIDDDEFLEAAESDTAGVPNTYTRLRRGGEYLRNALGMNIRLPDLGILPPGDQRARTRIEFSGFRD